MQKFLGQNARIRFSEKTNKISPSLHNFRLDSINHRGQTEPSARLPWKPTRCTR